MTILLSLSVLALAWLGLCLFAHGYSNTVDALAYRLHRHARSIREMHEKRAAILSERWMRELGL